MIRFIKRRSGIELVMVIILMGALSTISVALLSMVSSENALSSREIRQQQMQQVAEAGANYYRWHLAHYPNDYKDGTTGAGPYIHDFKNATGQVIGRFELTITPPPNGSTIATIQSVGYLLVTPKAKRTVTMQVGIPSLTKYAVVGNTALRFGEGTDIYGPIHSNSGLRVDGTAHGLVTSAQSSYDDPDHGTCYNGVTPVNEYAVHTHVLVSGSVTNSCPSAERAITPTPPDRSDIFQGGRLFPVAPIDFSGITVDLSTIRTKAQAGGIYLGPSGAQGYHLTLRTDGKIDMQIVNTQQRCQYRSGTGSCTVGTCSRRSCSNNVTKSCSGASGCPGGTCQFNSCSTGAQCPSSGSCIINNSCSLDSDCPTGGACANLHDYGYCSNNFNTLCSQDNACGTGNTCILSSHSIGSNAGDQSSFTYSGNPSIGYPLPANGTIFVADDVWVDGQINVAKITIAAAKDPISTGQARIFLNKDLKYTNYDGRDGIGLIAQQDILVGYFSQDTIRIDAAMIAQKGRIGRPYYGTAFTSQTNNQYFKITPDGRTNPSGGATCQEYRKRSALTTNGSLVTNQRYGFAWVGSSFNCGTSGNDSGYCDRTLSFDQNLVFGPPPSFPTTGEYRILSYTEH